MFKPLTNAMDLPYFDGWQKSEKLRIKTKSTKFITHWTEFDGIPSLSLFLLVKIGAAVYQICIILISVRCMNDCCLFNQSSVYEQIKEFKLHMKWKT